MKTFTKEELEKKNTKRLLAIKKKLYKSLYIYDDYVWDCDCSSCVEQKERYYHAKSQIELIKSICATREHVKKS